MLKAIIEFTIWREKGILKVLPTESFQCLKVYQNVDTIVSLTASYFTIGFKAVHKNILHSITYLIRPIMCSYHDYSPGYTTLNTAGGNLKNINLTIYHT